ncbi:hypothetical protein BN1708_018260, partial [Verticillium longisporum]
QLLIGVSAEPEFLQLITYIAATHSPDIKQIDTVRAYHSGPRYIVEIDVVMDRNERLEIAHDADAVRARDPAAVPTVAAQLAFDCLQSVPNKPAQAQRLITSLQAYVQWQSTLAWLKNPPATYMLPPADIEGALADIGRTAAAGGFGSEYNFQLAILETFASAHDGHFNYRGDVFKGFAFVNGLASDMISVSRDGKEPPRLYHSSMM